LSGFVLSLDFCSTFYQAQTNAALSGFVLSLDFCSTFYQVPAFGNVSNRGNITVVSRIHYINNEKTFAVKTQLLSSVMNLLSSVVSTVGAFNFGGSFMFTPFKRINLSYG